MIRGGKALAAVFMRKILHIMNGLSLANATRAPGSALDVAGSCRPEMSELAFPLEGSCIIHIVRRYAFPSFHYGYALELMQRQNWARCRVCIPKINVFGCKIAGDRNALLMA